MEKKLILKTIGLITLLTTTNHVEVVLASLAVSMIAAVIAIAIALIAIKLRPVFKLLPALVAI